MALTNDQITAQNFKDFYDQIRPYLNGQVPTFANQFSRGDLYSTDEKIVGQWIDGKPLYQLSLSNSYSYNTNDTLFVPTTTFSTTDKTIRSIDGMFYHEYGDTPHGANNSYFIQGSGGLCYVYNRWKNVGTYKGAVATVRYTKTTDSAVSVGTGTDYSTTEQIIGTWIDGKPLYQKTFTGSANSLVTDIWDDSTVEFVEFNGYAQFVSSGERYSLNVSEYDGGSKKTYTMLIRQSGTKFQMVKREYGDVTYAITFRYTKTTD